MCVATQDLHQSAHVAEAVNVCEQICNVVRDVALVRVSLLQTVLKHPTHSCCGVVACQARCDQTVPQQRTRPASRVAHTDRDTGRRRQAARACPQPGRRPALRPHCCSTIQQLACADALHKNRQTRAASPRSSTARTSTRHAARDPRVAAHTHTHSALFATAHKLREEEENLVEFRFSFLIGQKGTIHINAHILFDCSAQASK